MPMKTIPKDVDALFKQEPQMRCEGFMEWDSVTNLREALNPHPLVAAYENWRSKYAGELEFLITGLERCSSEQLREARKELMLGFAIAKLHGHAVTGRYRYAQLKIDQMLKDRDNMESE